MRISRSRVDVYVCMCALCSFLSCVATQNIRGPRCPSTSLGRVSCCGQPSVVSLAVGWVPVRIASIAKWASISRNQGNDCESMFVM